MKLALWIFFGLFTPSFAVGGETLLSVLKKHDLILETDPGLTVKSVSERPGKTIKFVKITAANKDGVKVELEFTSPLEKKKAEFVANTKLKIIKNMFDKQPTPYEGELTNISFCPDEFQPKNNQVNNRFLLKQPLQARATARYAWGNCSPGKGANIGSVAFYYDPDQKRLLRIVFFQKESSFSTKLVEDFLTQVKFKN